MINRIRLWLVELFLTVSSGQADPVKVAALVGILSTAGLFLVIFAYTVFTQSDLTFHVYVSPLPLYMGCKQVFDLMLGKHGWRNGAEWLLKPEQKAPDSASSKPDFRLLALALVYIWGGFYLLRV
ncbi:hypothetical protein [Aliamphritea hakodatensis]|uniref:hypothetical protein n=1 Tax=Aliamphritea hakodatensis TaxID=2895352 RepID=UPI0022FDAF0B|nr:hypothetical protein [Aliamphritea hakodatensis]